MRELIIDSFAGGGGASTGIEWALGRSPDIAINHSPDAIAMHALNHPATKHYCEDVWQVDPVEATAGRPVGLAWFSPDCTHFSKAKGGKPRSKKIRGLAWVVYRWARAVRPRVICLENVEEFADWGPLLEDGRPCPLRRGLTFRRWWRQLQNLGYEIDARELRAVIDKAIRKAAIDGPGMEGIVSLSAKDLAAILDERDEARADARRYRHLCEVHGPRAELCFDGEVYYGKDDFDAAIDAALREDSP